MNSFLHCLEPNRLNKRRNDRKATRHYSTWPLELSATLPRLSEIPKCGCNVAGRHRVSFLTIFHWCRWNWGSGNSTLGNFDHGEFARWGICEMGNLRDREYERRRILRVRESGSWWIYDSAALWSLETDRLSKAPSWKWNAAKSVN